MASTGIRIGALPILRLSDLKKMKGLYQFIIYSNSPNQRYITYCTPECAKAVDEYLAYRKRFGEKITPDSYLIRKDFDIHNIEQIRKKSEPIAYDTIKVIVRNQLMKTGVRSPFLVDSHKRHAGGGYEIEGPPEDISGPGSQSEKIHIVGEKSSDNGWNVLVNSELTNFRSITECLKITP
jgi:hypothetical protein